VLQARRCALLRSFGGLGTPSRSKGGSCSTAQSCWMWPLGCCPCSDDHMVARQGCLFWFSLWALWVLWAPVSCGSLFADVLWIPHLLARVLLRRQGSALHVAHYAVALIFCTALIMHLQHTLLTCVSPLPLAGGLWGSVSSSCCAGC
jgi:hypothetical protein